MSEQSCPSERRADEANALRDRAESLSDGKPDKEVREEVEHLRAELQQMTWASMKALACVCGSLIGVLLLIALQAEYPRWTLILLVPLGIFLFSNWGDWRATNRSVEKIKARLRGLEEQIKQQQG